MGNLGEALKQAGLHPRDVEFDKTVSLAVERFIASGGTNEGASLRLQWIVERMSGMGRTTDANAGHASPAHSRLEDEGAKSHLSKEQLISAPSFSPRDGKGQNSIAMRLPGLAHPVREPTMQQRMISARNAKVVAITILDRLKTSDGRSWGDVGAHELDGMARDGALAIAVKRKLGVLSNSQRFKPLRELIKADQFEAIYNKARENADAV